MARPINFTSATAYFVPEVAAKMPRGMDPYLVGPRPFWVGGIVYLGEAFIGRDGKPERPAWSIRLFPWSPPTGDGLAICRVVAVAEAFPYAELALLSDVPVTEGGRAIATLRAVHVANPRSSCPA